MHSTSARCSTLVYRRDIAQIRKWWCIMLMERYQIEGHRQRFSYLTNEARMLLKGALEPVYRVPKKRKTEHEVQFQKSDMCFILESVQYFTAAKLSSFGHSDGNGSPGRRGAHFRWLD
ncbi:tRNA N6-adenosine threonylcarbamoyltransferase, partial [Dissostichus eleginoides]